MPTKKEKLPLSVTHPELAKEADGWDPDDFVAGSHRKMTWKCSKRHKFQSKIEIRTKLDTSCPVCEGRVLLSGFNDLKTLHPRIAKEADGWDPFTVGEVSNKRFQWICPKNHSWKSTITSRVKGFQTECPRCFEQRITTLGKDDLKSVFPAIAKEVFGWDPSLLSYKSGRKVFWKCPKEHVWECIVRDRISRGTSCPICSGKQLLVGVTDLATTHPNIAKEAFGWDPSEIQKNSHKKLQWRCKKKHIYDSSVISRTHLKSGCPICSGNVLDPGKTDLASTHPKLAKEILVVDPATIKAGSHKSFDWQCPKGHQYRATAHYRQAGHNCPICAGKRVQAGFNDLATTNAESKLAASLLARFEARRARFAAVS